MLNHLWLEHGTSHAVRALVAYCRVKKTQECAFIVSIHPIETRHSIMSRMPKGDAGLPALDAENYQLGEYRTTQAMSLINISLHVHTHLKPSTIVNYDVALLYKVLQNEYFKFLSNYKVHN